MPDFTVTSATAALLRLKLASSIEKSGAPNVSKATVVLRLRLKTADEQDPLSSAGGTAMSLGLPLAGLGYGGHYLGKTLGPAVHGLGSSYDPQAHQIVGSYLKNDAAAPTAAAAMENHIIRGQQMLAMKPYGNQRGVDILQQVYDRFGPQLSKFIPGANIAAAGFTRPSQEHYGQFARGTAPAFEQLAREMQHQHGYMTPQELTPIGEARSSAVSEATRAATGIADPAARRNAFFSTFQDAFGKHLGYGQLTPTDKNLLQFYPDEQAITSGFLSEDQKQQLLQQQQQLRGKQYGFAHAGQYASGRNAAVEAMKDPTIPERIRAQAESFSKAIDQAAPAGLRTEDIWQRIEQAQQGGSHAAALKDRWQQELTEHLRRGMKAQYQALRQTGASPQELGGVLKDPDRLSKYYGEHGDLLRRQSQQYFDKADALRGRLGQLQQLQQSIGGLPGRIAAQAGGVTNVLSAPLNDLHLRGQMLESLRGHPEYGAQLAALGDTSSIKNVDLGRLPPEAQRYAVQQVLGKDPVAQTMALTFGKHYAAGPKTYGTLGRIITAPGQIAKPLGRGLSAAASYGVPVGRVGLGLAAAGIPLWLAGKMRGANKPDIRGMLEKYQQNQQTQQSTLESVLEELRRSKQPIPQSPSAPASLPSVPPTAPQMSPTSELLSTGRDALRNWWQRMQMQYSQ